MMKKTAAVIPALFLVWASAANPKSPSSVRGGSKTMFQLSSQAFPNEGMIPSKYTCDGSNISPQLLWTDPPAGTRSFALINDDPDAPAGTWVHWVIYGIPASARELKENFPRNPEIPDGTRQGTSDFGRVGYGGPCPPSGVHRYFFKLYSLDAALSISPGATKAQLESAMKGHILAECQIMGKYTRQR